MSLVDLFVNAGYAVYVDWIEDEELDRSEVMPKMAQLLKKRMNSSQGLAYVASSNTAQSKWCPWELGYFDGKKEVLHIANNGGWRFRWSRVFRFVSIFEVRARRK